MEKEKSGTPYYPGQRVRALRVVYEGGTDEVFDPQIDPLDRDRIFDAAYPHAFPGEVGIVQSTDEHGFPSVRWPRHTETTVSEEEIEILTPDAVAMGLRNAVDVPDARAIYTEVEAWLAMQPETLRRQIEGGAEGVSGWAPHNLAGWLTARGVAPMVLPLGVLRGRHACNMASQAGRDDLKNRPMLVVNTDRGLTIFDVAVREVSTDAPLPYVYAAVYRIFPSSTR